MSASAAARGRPARAGSARAVVGRWSYDALSAVLRGFDRRRHVRRAEKHHCRARARLAAGAAAKIDMEISSEQRTIVDSVQNLQLGRASRWKESVSKGRSRGTPEL